MCDFHSVNIKEVTNVRTQETNMRRKMETGIETKAETLGDNPEFL